MAPCSFIDVVVSEEPVAIKFCSESRSNMVLRIIGEYQIKQLHFLEISDINRCFAVMRTSGFKRNEKVPLCWHFF
jgi:hypothetical protein